MSLEVTTEIGLVDSRFGAAMRDPVTTTSATAGVSGAAAAGAASWACNGRASAATTASGVSRVRIRATLCTQFISDLHVPQSAFANPFEHLRLDIHARHVREPRVALRHRGECATAPALWVQLLRNQGENIRTESLEL